MIYVVVALPAEARPLIAHFGLERVEHDPSLTIFRRPDLCLTISGVGKNAAASAVSSLNEAVPHRAHAAWLNLGVAGHRNYPVGTLVVAESVLDQETREIWRGSPPSGLGVEKGRVVTVPRVEVEFASEALFDMEAAGFVAAASVLTAPGLIQVLKIVSDNLETGTVCVSAHQVQSLVERSLPTIDRLVSTLHRTARRGAQGTDAVLGEAPS